MIVLIGGRAGEGKSTFANFCRTFILSEKNTSSMLVPFAAKVKEVAFDIGWDGKKDDRGRRLLQEIGKIGREYDLDIWAKHVVNYIKDNHADIYEYHFIDDWRFPNEAKVIKEHFHPVVLVRMRRPEKEHSLYGTALYNDISEASLPDENSYYDYVIDNSGNLEELKTKAENLMSRLLERS